MPSDCFDSWKHSPPASAKEQVTADLLKQVGDAQSLSPQALNRIERRLRSARPRPFWLGNLALATAAAGALALALVVVLTVRRPGTSGDALRGSSARVASEKPDARTLAMNDVQPPPDAVPAAPEPTFLPKSPPLRGGAEKDALAKGLASRREPAAFSEPPRAWAGNFSKKAAKAPSPAERARSEDLAPPAASLQAAAAPPAGAGASAALGEMQLDAAPASGELKLECQDKIAKASAVLEGGPGDAESALFTRGRCRLQLGLREAGARDLRDYLTRFPRGQHVALVRELLRRIDQH